MVHEDMLARWHDLDRRRRELEREARLLKTELDQVGEQILAWMQAQGRRQLRRGAYEAVLLEARGLVAWKQEFIRVAGAEEAARLAAAAPLTWRVSVRRWQEDDR